jgi:hypothetical protein
MNDLISYLNSLRPDSRGDEICNLFEELPLTEIGVSRMKINIFFQVKINIFHCLFCFKNTLLYALYRSHIWKVQTKDFSFTGNR